MQQTSKSILVQPGVGRAVQLTFKASDRRRESPMAWIVAAGLFQCGRPSVERAAGSGDPRRARFEKRWLRPPQSKEVHDRWAARSERSDERGRLSGQVASRSDVDRLSAIAVVQIEELEEAVSAEDGVGHFAADESH